MRYACSRCSWVLTKELERGEFVETIDTEEVEFEGDIVELQGTSVKVEPGIVMDNGTTLDINYVEGLFLPEAARIEVMAINREDFLGKVPEYKTGMGCCDIDGEYVRCAGRVYPNSEFTQDCVAIVGMAFLDCWQIKRVELFKHTVREI